MIRNVYVSLECNSEIALYYDVYQSRNGENAATALNVDDINHIAALAQKGIPLFHIPALLQNRSQLVGQEIFDKCSHLHEDRYVDVKIDTFLRISKDLVRQRSMKLHKKGLPDT